MNDGILWESIKKRLSQKGWPLLFSRDEYIIGESGFLISLVLDFQSKRVFALMNYLFGDILRYCD